jgi:CRP-like cAMP-binding protein
MPSATHPFQPVNKLLALLPRKDREEVIRACEIVDLTFGATICEAGERVRHAYFPTSSFISLITPRGAAESLEVGMVGSEGMFGITLLMDVTVSPLIGLVQGEGRALRISASRFRRIANESTAFRNTLNRYMFVLTSQLAQTAACNRYHKLDARMARWLLMTQDRASSGTFRLTHQFLAYMLGARRAGVTEAAGQLQSNNLIRYARGRLTVLDRTRLEQRACPCYRELREIYTNHIGNV